MAQAKKKKKFFEVEIPLLKKETSLYGFDEKEFDGRIISYDLTRMLRGKNVLLKLKIILEGEKLTTLPIEMKLLPSFLRKMVRKGTNYVEDSFSADCADAKVRIKPFLVTRRKVSRAVRKNLRESAKEEIIGYVKDNTLDAIFKGVLNGQIQKQLSLRLKRVYPLSLCEIRVLEVEKKSSKR